MSQAAATVWKKEPTLEATDASHRFRYRGTRSGAKGPGIGPVYDETGRPGSPLGRESRVPGTLAPMSDSAYFVSPETGGPGVLLLHSWWGLTPFFRRLADRLADEGFAVLAPDLNFGATFSDPVPARIHLADADAGRLASLVLAGIGILAEKAEKVGIVGFSMGASLGLWASIRRAADVDAVAAFYGTQSIDFAGARAAYQIHLADDDDLVSDDEAALMQATIGLEGLPVEVFRYPGTRHWFFEADRAEHDHDAADVAWTRLAHFLAARLAV